MDSFEDIIGLWPSCEALGSDIGESGNVVRKWRLRDSIPASVFNKMIASAASRGIEGVTSETLLNIAEQSRTRAA